MVPDRQRAEQDPHVCQGCELRRRSEEAYGIEWIEDLFAPADEDSRYTTNVEAYLGAQQEWMTDNLPKKGVIAEVTQWGEAKLPQKASRVYGKPSRATTPPCTWIGTARFRPSITGCRRRRRPRAKEASLEVVPPLATM